MENEWQIGRREGYYDWYYITKNFNGTDYEINIWPYEGSKSTKLWVGVTSGNKRKHLEDYDAKGAKRLGGISALIWIKKMVLEFPEYYIDQKRLKKGHKLYTCINWSDSLRRDVYIRALGKEGFQFFVEDGKKVLRKKIIV